MHNVWLIARREYIERIRTRGFLVTTIMIICYLWFTTTATNWRMAIRRSMNESDTDANTKAIDSLLNYETVKYFGAEKREADRYDLAGERRKSQAVLEILERDLVLFLAAGFPLDPAGDVLLRGVVEGVKIFADGLSIDNKLVGG